MQAAEADGETNRCGVEPRYCVLIGLTGAKICFSKKKIFPSFTCWPCLLPPTARTNPPMSDRVVITGIGMITSSAKTEKPPGIPYVPAIVACGK